MALELRRLGETQLVERANAVSITIKYVEIGEQRDYDLLTAQCTGSAKFLPPPPAQLVRDGGEAPAPATQPSLADELKKLADLRNSGVITEPEFEAAKKKLLASPSGD